MEKDIVITGNIGVGKSTVTKIFNENGFEIISADTISSEILEKNQNEVAEMFGMSITTLQNFKKKLGTVIFQNKEKKKKLEEFMIPKIYQKIEEVKAGYKKKNTPFVLELPTFFETRGLKRHNEFYVINIFVEEEERLKRIKARNPELSYTEIRNRMASQISPELKNEYSDLTIENNLGRKELEEQITPIVKTIKEGKI